MYLACVVLLVISSGTRLFILECVLDVGCFLYSFVNQALAAFFSPARLSVDYVIPLLAFFNLTPIALFLSLEQITCARHLLNQTG